MPYSIYIHQLLIDYMNQRSFRVSSNGICLGIASMGIHAFLLDEEELQNFCKRINTILTQLPITGLYTPPATINLAQQTDIDIFLEGVLFYQRIYKYKKLLTNDPNVNFTVSNYHSSAFEIIKPEKLNHRNMYKLSSILGCYNITEIVKFLNILKTTIVKIFSTKPVGLMLYIHNHIIALGYNCKENAWKIIDANMLYLADQNFSCQDTAKLLIRAFTMKDLEDNVKIVFSTELIFTTDSTMAGIRLSTELQNNFTVELHSNSEWEQIHKITADKIHKTNEGSTWLFMAARNGDLPLVNQLILAKADVNFKKENGGLTPLWVAVQEGNFDVAIALIDANAAINCINSVTGSTPLIIASQNNNVKMVNLLLEMDADVNRQNTEGITALLATVKNNHLESLKLLLMAEADPNLTANDNITPLRIAIKNNNYKIVEALMMVGAKIDKSTTYEPTSLNFNNEENMGENFFPMYDSRDYEGFCTNTHCSSSNQANNLNSTARSKKCWPPKVAGWI